MDNAAPQGDAGGSCLTLAVVNWLITDRAISREHAVKEVQRRDPSGIGTASAGDTENHWKVLPPGPYAASLISRGGGDRPIRRSETQSICPRRPAARPSQSCDTC